MPDLVSHLAQLIVEDNAILFVGSALRGEQGEQAAVEQMATALAARVELERGTQDLSAVAEYFQDRKGRGELLRALQEELGKLALQPDPIHNLVADAVLPTTKVITTRWDQLLERALEQYGKEYVLIVRDKDVPFFDETKITLVKMQGDIGQPESLVVTEEDIEGFFERLPTLSDVIRAFFATKTLVFLGYDLNSELFKRFYRKLLRNVGSFSRTVYAIVPEPLDEATTLHWQQRNVQIHTQPPTDFLEALAQAVKALGPAAKVVPPQPPLPERPYKGPASFAAADERVFRGRSEETMRLLNRVLANRTVLLYGESGSGKTSLVQAGLAPELARRGALLAMASADASEPLTERLRGAVRAAAEAYGLLLGAADDLPTLIQRVQPALKGPLVLVVDQGEQLFLLPEGDALAALHALQSLIEDERLDVRLLLVLREDFLGRLHTLERQLPGLLDARFRLERLSREAARSAIEEPAREFGIVWEPALVERLLDELYEGTVGGIAPPPLQLVCEALARPIIEGGGARTITLATFEALGGSEAILGGYLDEVLLRLPPAQQPTARALLGDLVGSSRLKQRLALEPLARNVGVAPGAADAILDFLCENGIVRRYEGATISYELTHDFLIGHIVRWLDETFWLVQEARELVREGLREWTEREGLLPPGKLRRVAAQRERLRLSAPEAAMLYAAAVGYDVEPALWEPLLDAATQRAVLLTLLRQPEATISRQAAPALARIADAAAVGALAESALAHPDAAVRAASAEALVTATLADEALLDAALPPLLAASDDPTRGSAARGALLRLSDRNPATHERLPAALRGPLRRAVWQLRLRRGWPSLLAATLQGLQGGFWGLGLGMGLFLGLYSATLEIAWPFINPEKILGLMLTGLSLAGVLGALAIGSGAAAGTLVTLLQDRESEKRTWLIKSGTSTFFFVGGFLILALILFGRANLPRVALAALLIGATLTGIATMPTTLSAPLHLLLTVLGTVAAFFLADQLGLLFTQSTGWALLMGVAAGLGGFLGLNPSVWRALWRRVAGRSEGGD